MVYMKQNTNKRKKYVSKLNSFVFKEQKLTFLVTSHELQRH